MKKRLKQIPEQLSAVLSSTISEIYQLSNKLCNLSSYVILANKSILLYLISNPPSSKYLKVWRVLSRFERSIEMSFLFVCGTNLLYNPCTASFIETDVLINVPKLAAISGKCRRA
jgi:hypothetical protein